MPYKYMTAILTFPGLPQMIVSDNGTEFRNYLIVDFCHLHKYHLIYPENINVFVLAELKKILVVWNSNYYLIINIINYFEMYINLNREIDAYQWELITSVSFKFNNHPLKFLNSKSQLGWYDNPES